MSRSLRSSANLPCPRRRRLSSLRGIALPTQPAFCVVVLNETPREFSLECGLQSVDQLLNIFLAERLEQSTGNGGELAKDLGLALPGHLSTGSLRCKIKASRHGDVSACHTALSFILRARWLLGL